MVDDEFLIGAGQHGDRPGPQTVEELRKLKLLAKPDEGQHCNLASRKGPLTEMRLIEMRNRRSFSEISNRRADSLLP